MLYTVNFYPWRNSDRDKFLTSLSLQYSSPFDHETSVAESDDSSEAGRVEPYQ